MTKPACLLRPAQIAGIDETNKHGRLMINQCIRNWWIGRTSPEFGMLGLNMCRFFGKTGRRIAAVTIRATKHDMAGLMHGLDSLMALQAAGTFCVCLRLGLVNPIARRGSNNLSL